MIPEFLGGLEFIKYITNGIRCYGGLPAIQINKDLGFL